MTQGLDALPALPRDREHPLQPPCPYAKLAAERAVTKVRYPDDSQVWLVTGFEDFRSVLSDSRLRVLAAGKGPQLAPGEVPEIEELPGNFAAMDGPEHLRYRRMLSRFFMPKHINRMRPRMQELVDERLDAMEQAGPGADLVRDYTTPVVSGVIAELLGVPKEGQQVFAAAGETLLRWTSTAEEIEQALGQAQAVLVGVIEAAMKEPGDGVIAELVREDNGLSPEELVTIGFSLLFAGGETPANFTALSVLSLLDNPDQLAEFMSEPELVPRRLEELLRYLSASVVSPLIRSVAEDIEVGGELIRAGEYLSTAIATANRDARQFADPDKLDFHREQRAHVAFGHGPHQCIGQNLARVEVLMMLTSLFTRFPNLKLDGDLKDLPYRSDTATYGVYQLPVTW